LILLLFGVEDGAVQQKFDLLGQVGDVTPGLRRAYRRRIAAQEDDSASGKPAVTSLCLLLW
jgi:hypothetical protein